MKTDILHDWHSVAALAPEWNELLRDSESDTVFLTWEWISCWISIHQKRARPFVIVVRDDAGRLCGLLPLYFADARLVRVVPFRVLRYVADYATGQEYPDWIVRRGHETAACTAIARTLADSTDEWDCVWMPRIASWTGALERMRRACDTVGFWSHIRPRDFAATPLPDSADAFMQSLSSQRRAAIRSRCRKILGRDGVTVRRCHRPEDVSVFLEALFELHHKRRQLMGDAGTFRRKPTEAEFYRRFAPLALERGWLSMFGLEERGEFKAIQIGYAYGGVFNQMQEGFEPTYQSGAGNVLRLKVIEHCIEEGVRELDFLGEWTEHKRRWQARHRTGHELFVGHPSLKNRLIFTREVGPTGRYVSWPAPLAAAGA